ncbi:MAG: ECF transporter S component [Oscillospiraceae bacterium]|nr:ECF transporter S component [Oscillospiraceae bacterium]
MQTSKNHTKILYLTQMAVLIAIMLVLELTGLGMIKIGILEMTILQFPVIVGAILMGQSVGAALGLVFGLISFWECFGKSAFGTALLGINPIFTFLVCVPTRTLMGWLCGLIYAGLRKLITPANAAKGLGYQAKMMIPYVAASLGGALLNTLFFMTTLLVLFGATDYIRDFMAMSGTENMLAFACWFVGVQGLVEALLCAFLGTVVSRGVNAVLKK